MRKSEAANTPLRISMLRNASQKAVFQRAKSRLLERKRPSFETRKAVFWNAKDGKSQDRRILPVCRQGATAGPYSPHMHTAYGRLHSRP